MAIIGTIANRDELLLPLEKRFPEGYQTYYAIKRNKSFAGVTTFPDMWECFLRLDEIMTYELEVSSQITEFYRLLPFMLFGHAHAQLKIALELGFTGTFPEAFNIARMAVESAYQGHKLISDPTLASTWAKRDRGEAERKDFRKAFDFEKSDGYAALGLSELHKYWTQFSEWSHPSVSSLNQRFTMTEVKYFETDPERKALNIFSLLFAMHKIENALFAAFVSRLKLDYGLEKRRIAFGQMADRMRVGLIKKFDLKRPGAAPDFGIILVDSKF
jgi:hypothetical protein